MKWVGSVLVTMDTLFGSVCGEIPGDIFLSFRVLLTPPSLNSAEFAVGPPHCV